MAKTKTKTTKEKTKHALLSVFHKDGIDKFARALIELGFTIVSSGGTAKFLSEKGVPVIDVAEITDMSPILGHRVVTLHPKIHGGLLALPSKEHDLVRAEHDIPWFELLCVDMYPLAEAIAKGKDYAAITEMMDIGGPTMLSSASKGCRIVICDPADRERVLTWLSEGCPDDEDFRRQLSAKADFVVSEYRMLTARHLGGGEFEGIHGVRVVGCKGENGPQTPAALHSSDTNDPLALDQFELLEGSPLSYNNWCDVDRALAVLVATACTFNQNLRLIPRIAIAVKHGNPCGAGVCVEEGTEQGVIEAMVEGDPLAIFGGLIIVNFEIDEGLAHILSNHRAYGERRLLDAVVAPSFTSEACEVLRRKRGGCRILVNPVLGDGLIAVMPTGKRIRQVRGGFLMQGEYSFVLDWDHPEIKCSKTLSPDKMIDMMLAWAICARSNSNTVTIVKGGMLIGNGTGQQSRVDAAKLAVSRARDRSHDIIGAVAASDSFFPFPDGPIALAGAGVTHIFATSGSIKDGEVATALEEAGVTFVTLPDSIARGFYRH